MTSLRTVAAGSDRCELAVELVGTGPAVVLLHAGGPDHYSMRPLANMLAADSTVILPDLRGYGASVCRDPALHTWARYVADLVAVLDELGYDDAVIAGTGLGATVALRAAIEHPTRVRAVAVIGLEDIEDDEAKAAEVEFLDAFARRVRTDGIAAAWAPILEHLPPLVGALVQDAIPRSDPESIAAAGAIGRDRSFRDVAELGAIDVPVLIFAGTDWRHPRALAAAAAELIPRGMLGHAAVDDSLRDADDMAAAFGPELRAFVAACRTR